MRRVRHGPVMVAGESGSVPAAAHPALYLQMPSLAACKTLGAHALIQAFRRLRARFLNERAGPGAGRKEDAGAGRMRRSHLVVKSLTHGS